MRAALLRIAALLLCLLAAGDAMAQPVCDLRDEVAFPAVKDFGARPKGALGLGQSCEDGTCDSYIDVTPCERVLYPLARSGQSARIHMAVSITSNCGPDCKLVDSVFAASLLYRHEGSTDPIAPFAELIRNPSPRWTLYQNSRLSKDACCLGVIEPELFATAQTGSNSPWEFFRQTGKRWHSAFVAVGRGTMETWTFRSFFTNALERCGADCSIKAFLLRFTDAIRAEAAPKPLLFSAKVMSFSSLRLLTLEPLGEELYEHELIIDLIR